MFFLPITHELTFSGQTVSKKKFMEIVRLKIRIVKIGRQFYWVRSNFPDTKFD